MGSERIIEVSGEGVPAYQIRIGAGALSKVGSLVRGICDGERAAVISDSTVGPAYGKLVRKRLAEAGFEVSSFDIPAGEESKTPETAVSLAEDLARAGLERTDVVVAVGGGVVSDIAGLVASTYKRGVAFVIVATTLLSMADASIGGKTAVNLEAGKNLFGTFHQPRLVVSDTRCLHTLRDEDWACGMGEIAKSALIAPRRSSYEWLRDHASELADHDDAAVAEAVYLTADFKASVVSKDARESGLRECLNYGHTLAHAIEAVAGYGRIAHGRAVAEGMRFAARLSVEMLGCDMEVVGKQDALLDSLGLAEIAWTADAGHLLAHMFADKKNRGGHLRFVLLRDITKWELVEVAEETVESHLAAWCASKERLIAKSGGRMWGEGS